IPLWWWTYRPLLGDPIKPPSIDSSWMFTETMTDTTYRNYPDGKVDAFTISPQGMAAQILAADPKATVIAYSWIDDSATPTSNLAVPENAYASEGLTFLNGLRLAVALQQALAPNFQSNGGALELAGHSHGSRVATVAALALHVAAVRNGTTSPVKQVAILDSPEGNNTALLDAANFNWFFLSQLKLGRDPFANPDTLFVDNYISEFDDLYDN